ncbi:hypothetical protein KC361_g156 [Hortaea werneckii]|nr:hypothetical protein KC361_g156 [Hortaea werneckii]
MLAYLLPLHEHLRTVEPAFWNTRIQGRRDVTYQRFGGLRLPLPYLKGREYNGRRRGHSWQETNALALGRHAVLLPECPRHLHLASRWGAFYALRLLRCNLTK